MQTKTDIGHEGLFIHELYKICRQNQGTLIIKKGAFKKSVLSNLVAAVLFPALQPSALCHCNAFIMV